MFFRYTHSYAPREFKLHIKEYPFFPPHSLSGKNCHSTTDILPTWKVLIILQIRSCYHRTLRLYYYPWKPHRYISFFYFSWMTQYLIKKNSWKSFKRTTTRLKSLSATSAFWISNIDVEGSSHFDLNRAKYPIIEQLADLPSIFLNNSRNISTPNKIRTPIGIVY